MLHRLYISNFTLIDQISIDLENGFTIVTGQTGAGKSIILGALSLVLGKRAESDLLFDASKKCIIESEFSTRSKSVKHFLKVNDLLVWFMVLDNIVWFSLTIMGVISKIFKPNLEK